jgi:LmbE family N-acetylglucosaminyl deacetylase
VLPSLGVVDQEATLAIADITRAIALRLASLDVDVVVTHPYEGGHPDHDAVAFAVHAALELYERARPVLLAEMSSYHEERGRLVTARFLECGVPRCHRSHPGTLDDAARARRRRMLDAFASQTAVLSSFGDTAEPLRCAPRYDFERAPHPGPLHYERLPFGWTGARWRELARAAREELGLGERPITARPCPPRDGGSD